MSAEVKDFCCLELKITFETRTNETLLADLSGYYRYSFDQKRIKEIEAGSFTYKRKEKPGYIFRNNDGFWSVSTLTRL